MSQSPIGMAAVRAAPSHSALTAQESPVRVISTQNEHLAVKQSEINLVLVKQMMKEKRKRKRIPLSLPLVLRHSSPSTQKTHSSTCWQSGCHLTYSGQRNVRESVYSAFGFLSCYMVLPLFIPCAKKTNNVLHRRSR